MTAVAKRKSAKQAARKGPAPPPAFPQRAGASPKQLLLFELMRARAVFLAAIQGLMSGTSEPIAPGKWTPHEIVLHLVTRDQARLRELESTLRGTPASWKNAKPEDWAQINETNLAPLRHHDWDEAVRLLHRTRQQLVEELESVPEEPSEPWSADHAFGSMLAGLPPHDRHHAEQIKHWRAHRGA
jgi:DinB family protein